jgi:adenylate cyclase
MHSCGKKPPEAMVCQLHTFLFADLVDFTRLTAEHGDEHAAELATCFQEQVAKLASPLGCDVVKTIGDAVMVRSDNGDCAIELGLEILDLVQEVGLPRVRVGLDTGTAVRRNEDWFGSTVNTASRVAAAANAGELLMTERTRRASTRASRIEPCERGTYELKGLPPHSLYAA